MATSKRGLQPERTSIAWIRTAMALAVNAILLARQGLVHAGPIGKLLLVVSAALCLGYFVLFFLRARSRDLLHYERGVLPLAEIRIISVLTVAASATTVVVILLS